MAKALFGHVGGGTDLRLVSEVRRLRARVRELEEELTRTRDANEALMTSMTMHDEEILRLPRAEPALT